MNKPKVRNLLTALSDELGDDAVDQAALLRTIAKSIMRHTGDKDVMWRDLPNLVGIVLIANTRLTERVITLENAIERARDELDV